MARRITSVYPTVLRLMREDAKYRDDDEKLVARIWHDELIAYLKKYHPQTECSKEVSAHYFLRLYVAKAITDADSITRARRRVEQKFPELRGLTWEQRQKKERKAAQVEIRNLNN